MMLIFVLLAIVIPSGLWAFVEKGKDNALTAYCKLECKEYQAYHKMSEYNGYPY